MSNGNINPAFKIVTDYDLSKGDKSFIISPETLNKISSQFAQANVKYIAVQVISKNFTAGTATIKIQDSLNGENFNDIDGGSITIDTGTNSNMIRYWTYAATFLKVVLTRNGVAGGTMDVWVSAK